MNMNPVPDLEDIPEPDTPTSFSYTVAARGFHHYKVTTWADIYDGEKVTVHRETNDVSLQHDRYACLEAVKGRKRFACSTVGNRRTYSVRS